MGDFFTAMVNVIAQNWLDTITTGYFTFFAILLLLVGLLFIFFAPNYQEKIYMKNISALLPMPTLGYQSKIKQITNIILLAGQKNIILIILLYPFTSQ